jgi:hypothetical protein
MMSRQAIFVVFLIGNILLGKGEAYGQPPDSWASPEDKRLWESTDEKGRSRLVRSIDEHGKIHVKKVDKVLKHSSPPPLNGVLPEGLEKQTPECGVNALYVFLRLQNIICPLAEIKQEVPFNEKGASLLDLKETASKHGITSDIIHASPSALDSRLPAIARMTVPNMEQDGHYVVVTKMSDESVEVIDSTAGGFITVPRGLFEREFSGYALVPNATWYGAITAKWNLVLEVVIALEVAALIAGVVGNRLATR